MRGGWQACLCILSAAMGLSCGSHAPSSAQGERVAQVPKHKDVRWTVPGNWRPLGTKGEEARYALGGAGGEEAIATVVRRKGPPEALLHLWSRELEGGFESLRRSSRKVAGFEVTIADAHGALRTFARPGETPEPPKAGQALIAVTVDSTPPCSFKILGSEQAVDAARPEVERLIASFRPVD